MDRRSREWRRAVYRCQALLGNREDAEDCVQDALLAALSRDLDTIEDLEGFVTAVARRRAIDRIRHRQVRQHVLPRLALRDDTTTPDIAEGVTNRYEAAWLVAKLKGLPPKTRAVVACLAAGKSLGETAEELGLSYRAAESHVTRARRFARGWLAGPAAVLAWLAAGLRRTVSTAPAAGLVFTIAIVITPPEVDVDNDTRVMPHAQVLAPARTLDIPRVSPRSRPRDERRAAPDAVARVRGNASEHAAPMAEAQVPGGAVGLREEQRPGPDDPISNITGCVERFEVSLERIGC